MDEILAFLFVLGLIILGPWVFVIIMARRRKRERVETEERVALLTARVYRLEQQLKDLAGRPAAPAPAPAEAPAPVVRDVPVIPPAAAPPPFPAAPAPRPAPIAAPKPEPPPAPAPRPVAPPPAPPLPARPLPDRPVIAEPARASASVTAPAVARVAAPPVTPPSPPPPKRNVEQAIAEYWLVLGGVILVVLGTAFGLSLVWERLGPAGKVAIGFLSAFALLGAGLWLEKKEKYRTIGRATLGGGWALLFFVTYAMHHVPATQVIQSQALDLALMLVVAGAMVAHTLRYDSQLVTGMAFILAFSTVTISQVSVYSLAASAVLALALAVIVVRRRWFELEVFGILATYLNYWWWVRRIIEPMGDTRHMFAEYYPSVAILALYWAAYRASYVLREVHDENEERVSTIAAILNTSLLLFVLKYQSVSSQYAFYTLLAIGVLELGIAFLVRARERRTAFVILSMMGASLTVAAFPFKFSGGDLSILWLLVAEFFYLAGVFLDELPFRRFGRIAEMVVTVQLFYSHPLDAPKSLSNAMVFIVAAVLFGANSHLVPWRWPKIFETRWEQFGARLLSWLGVLMAGTAIWLAVPEEWAAVGWAVLALWLALAGTKLRQRDLNLQAAPVALLAAFATFAINFPDDSMWRGMTLRLITVSLVAAALYLTSRWSAPQATTGALRVLRPGYTWAATVLLTVLAAYEITAAWIPVVWALFGILLVVLGRRAQLRDLVLQGNLLAFLAFAHVLIVNSTHGEPWRWGMSVRLVTSALTIVALYVASRWAEVEDWAWTRALPALHAWTASFLVAWTMWYEMLPVSVGVGWALFGLGLFELGMSRPHSPRFWRAQGYIALSAAFLRLFFVNMNAGGALGEISPRVYTVVPVAIMLYYVYGRLETTEDDFLALDRRWRMPQWLVWMGTITVAGLARFEVPLDWVVAAWAAMVGVLVALTWYTGRQVFLAQGLLLTVAVAFRTVMHNFYERSYFPPESAMQRWLPVGVTVGLLFMALYPAFRVRRFEGEPGWLRAIGRRPEQVLFFAGVGLLTALLFVEATKTMITVAWGVEAIAIFVFALMVGERSFRLTGLGLLLVAIAKIVFYDVWQFGDNVSRAITFVIVGLLALGMGLLYTRNRERLRQYL